MFAWQPGPRSPWRLSEFEGIPYRMKPEPPKLKTCACRVCGDYFEVDARANSAAACSDACRDVLTKRRERARYERRL